MALRLRRPNDPELGELLDRCRTDHLTYEPVGCSLGGAVPTGLHPAEWTTELDGPEAFDRGVAAIRAWAVHRGADLTVVADGPIAVGTNVAMGAPLPIGFVDVTCRIVAVVDEPDRFGFAYGTLSVHPEVGEESFVLTRTPSGARFDVRAVSAPAHPLARLAPPIARRLQRAAVDRYSKAMRAAVHVPSGEG